MTNTPPPEKPSMTEPTYEQAVANWISQARAELGDLRDNPAPCGHVACTERDLRSLEAGQVQAGVFIGDLGQLGVDPMDAVRVLVDVDFRLVDPALDLKTPQINAWDLHTMLASIAVALFDVAQIREGAAQ